MKNAFKKIVTAIIAVTMTAGMTYAAGAEIANISVFNPINAMDTTVADLLFVYYGDDISVTDAITYGSEIPVYNYSDKVLLESEQLKLYPVYINNNLSGYIRESIVAGNSNFSYSEEFVTDVNNFGAAQYNFISVEDILYISSEDSIEAISSDNNSEIGISTFATGINESLLDSMDFYSPSSAKRYVNPTSTYSTNGDNISYYLNVPAKNIAASLGLCWAGSVEAVGEYMTGNISMEPSTIASHMGIGSGGAYNSQVKNALSQIYEINTEASVSIPSFSYIAYKIGSGKPIIANLQSPSKGHYMTIIGYGATSSSYYVKVMDTEGGTYRAFKLTDGKFSICYSVETFTWSSAILPV